jgi:hypothetical protein
VSIDFSHVFGSMDIQNNVVIILVWMDRLVSIFHGGIAKKNKDYTVEFQNMVEVFLNFPSLTALVGRVKGKLDWPDSVLCMHMDGVVDVGSSKGTRTNMLVSLDS